MMLKNIHWHSLRLRLPLSYILIALLVALITGFLLLTILSGFYTQQERDYMQSNAVIISQKLRPELELGHDAEHIRTFLQTYSFLSRSQVTYTGIDEAPIVVDVFSGDVDPYQFQPYIISSDDNPSATTISPDTESEAMGSRVIVTTSNGNEAPQVGVTSSLYSYALNQSSDDIASNPNIPRSSQSVTLSVTDGDGIQYGTITLTGGPAYGVEIVQSVARGWAIASIGAVSMAIIIGIFISRSLNRPLAELMQTTDSMAEGNLTARADIQRQDEFGNLAQAFNHMAEHVESLVMTLKQFVSDAAHEMKTPLTALQTNLELLNDDSDNPALVRTLAEIQRLNRLTDSLLQLSRIEATVNTPDFMPVDVVALIREVTELHASRAEQANLNLTLNLPDHQVICSGDVESLRRAVNNLLENAIKFTPAGGDVQLSLREVNQHVEIKVEDSGIGIPLEDLPHLFNRFYRGRGVSRYVGSGLGLAIVKAVVQQHKGIVTAVNREQGTCFTICLSQVNLS